MLDRPYAVSPKTPMMWTWRWKLLAWFSHRAAGIFFRGTSMKSKLLGLMAIVPLLGLSPANASTYNVDFLQPKSGVTPFESVVVTGTIVTDCDSCVLQASDFVSWAFTITGTMNGSFSGGPANVDETSAPDSPLSAGGGVIEYSSSAVGSLRFRLPNLTEYILFGPNEIYAVLNCIGCDAYDSPEGIGIATETVAASTPLPAALPLFATGLGALGLLGWRRKRKAAAIA
jgi:hypothetical protein